MVCLDVIIIIILNVITIIIIAQSAGAIEYTDCFSVEG